MKGPCFELPTSPSKPFTISSLQQIQLVLTLSSNNETKVFLVISLGQLEIQTGTMSEACSLWSTV